LTPMMASRLLKKRERHPWFYRVTEPFFDRFTGAYEYSLRVFLNHRWLALPVMLACFGAIAWFWTRLPQELAPLEDRGLLVLSVNGPQGANFDYMSEVMGEVDELLLRE